MAEKDGRLDPLRSFIVSSLRFNPEKWREFVSEEENQVVFNSFHNSQDYCNLFIYLGSGSALTVSLNFPNNVQSKVICVSKPGHEVITTENIRTILSVQEVRQEDAMIFFLPVCDEVRQLPELTVRYGSFNMTTSVKLWLIVMIEMMER